MTVSTWLLPITAPLSWLFRAGVALRNRHYDRATPSKLPVPVVSVGNVTVGGSGKTPFVAALAKVLAERRLPVAVLSRGYGRRSTEPYVLVSDEERVLVGPEEAGDEPVELAERVPGLVVAVGDDRFATGSRLLRELGPRVILLDDGFQHRRLYRDLDIVCIDARESPSSARLLPAGRLREPLSSLERADLVVWTRAGDGHPTSEVLRCARGRPSIRTRTFVRGYVRVGGNGERLPAVGFREEPVALLTGIARPERVLEGLDADVVLFRARRDHHAWTAGEVNEIATEARAKGARTLLTTAKDAVKMKGFEPVLPLYRIELETEILDRDVLDAQLDRLPSLGV